MANLHKVKGLEAPIVILAAASSFPSQIEKRIEYGSDRPQGYLFRLGKNNNGLKKGSYFKTEKLTDESNKEKEAGKEERKRLVYVAATRARNVLIINRIKKSPDDEKEPAKNKTQRSEWKTSVWKDLFEETLPDFFEIVKEFAAEAKINAETATAADLYKEAENTCVINKNRTAEDATYNVDNPSRLRLSSKAAGKENTNMAEGSDIDMSEEEQRQTDGVPAAVIGTMIHRLMEMLVSSKNRTDVNGAVEEIVKEYCPVGFSDGERKQLKKVLCEVAEKIRNGGYPQEKDSPDILGILLKADKVYCEVPFCYEESG